MNEEILSQLERLNYLKTSGGITEAEFEQYKTALLRGVIVDPSPTAKQTLVGAKKTDVPQISKTAKVLIGSVVFLLVFWGIFFPQGKPTTNQASMSKLKEELILDSIENANMGISATVATVPDSLQSDWSSSDFEDDMDGKVHLAQAISANTLFFDFPYQGGSKAILAIQKRRGTLYASLRVTSGQFTSDYNNPAVRIKIDNKPTASYSTSAASDGSSDVLFIDSAYRLIDALRGSKKTTIEAQFYQGGNRKMEFNTKGFAWK